MSTVSGEALIHAPLHDVFAIASDYRHWSEWFVGTSRFRPVTDLTRGTGTRYAYRVRVLGLSVPVETEVCDFVEDGGWRGVSRRGPRHETRWQFVPEGDGTRFTFRMDYELPLVAKFLDRLFVRPEWQRVVQESAQNLKRRVEGCSGASA